VFKRHPSRHVRGGHFSKAHNVTECQNTCLMHRANCSGVDYFPGVCFSHYNDWKLPILRAIGCDYYQLLQCESERSQQTSLRNVTDIPLRNVTDISISNTIAIPLPAVD